MNREDIGFLITWGMPRRRLSVTMDARMRRGTLSVIVNRLR